MVWIIDEELSGSSGTDSTSNLEPSYLTHELGWLKNNSLQSTDYQIDGKLDWECTLNLPGRQQSQKT